MAESKKKQFSRPITKPCDAPVNGDELLTELENTFKRYVVLPDHASTALALWTVATYLRYDPDGKIKFAPRLMVISPTRGCGKSVLLSILGYLCERPLMTGNISHASLYRIIEAEKPIIPLVDECDGYVKGNSDMANILNNGFMRGYPVIRCRDSKDLRPMCFDCFTPVAVAGINKVTFAAPTIDRSIIIQMHRKRPNEHVDKIPRDDIFGELRQKCARFVQDFQIAGFPFVEQAPGLNNRRFDVWENLLSLAKFASDEWYQKTLVAARHLSKENADDDSADLGIQLLANIREVLTLNWLSSQRLCEKLTDNEEWPWSEMGYREQPLTPRKMASLLKPFGIHSRENRNDSGANLRGYFKSDFESAWADYLDPLPETNATPLQDIDFDPILNP